VPVLTGTYFTFDWQHVGRRAIDDINSEYTRSTILSTSASVHYEGLRKLTTWRVTANDATDVHYWSTLGPAALRARVLAAISRTWAIRFLDASMRFSF